MTLHSPKSLWSSFSCVPQSFTVWKCIKALYASEFMPVSLHAIVHLIFNVITQHQELAAADWQWSLSCLYNDSIIQSPQLRLQASSAERKGLASITNRVMLARKAGLSTGCRMVVTATGFDGRLIHAAQQLCELQASRSARGSSPCPGLGRASVSIMADCTAMLHATQAPPLVKHTEMHFMA